MGGIVRYGTDAVRPSVMRRLSAAEPGDGAMGTAMAVQPPEQVPAPPPLADETDEPMPAAAALPPNP
eukprot:8467566-Lingulodinium_polyedra.AAC.1